MVKSDSELMIAELSALYEISSLLFLDSEEDILRESLEKAVRLFGVRYYLLFYVKEGDIEVISSWGFRNPENFNLKKLKPNQFYHSFNQVTNLKIFMEQSSPIDQRQLRIYNLFINSLENSLIKARNILMREKAERALRESEIMYRTIFENTGTGTLILEEDGTILLVNSEFERLSGYVKEEVQKKKNWKEFLSPEEKEKIMDYHKLRRNDPSAVPQNYEFQFQDKNKNLRDFYINVALIPGTSKSLVSLLDISPLKKTERELKISLKEKKMLLKEIHHRVKNNLMVISSLLNIQSRKINDAETRDIFKESQNRAKAMALIHERLYRSSDLKKINFGEYVRSLSTDIFHTYMSHDNRLDLKLQVEDIMLDIDTIVPLGLILNELVSNCLKHAFPSGKEGEIKVDFHKKGDEFVLKVIDDGIGFPNDLDYKNTSSLGLQLIYSLADQIDATIILHRGPGTEFDILFREMAIEKE